jgi:hypothetical protein
MKLFFAAGALALLVPGWERIADNQRAARSTLRTIAEAQAELQAAVEIDTNCDGIGEYGYFEELAGVVPMRVSAFCEPGAGTVPWDILSPPLLRSPFDHVAVSLVARRGYFFQMWLPYETVAGTVPGIPEDASGGKGAAPFPGSVNGARMWCCYAWPIDYGRTGNRAYFLNQRGLLLECQNRSLVPYDGTTKMPAYGEAYTVADDMSSPLRVGAAGGNDMTIWTLVQP